MQVDTDMSCVSPGHDDVSPKSRACASPETLTTTSVAKHHPKPLVPARKKFQIRNILEQLEVSREAADASDLTSQQSTHRSVLGVDKTVDGMEDVMSRDVSNEQTNVADVARVPVPANLDESEAVNITPENKPTTPQRCASVIHDQLWLVYMFCITTCSRYCWFLSKKHDS
jgi:hypothetical protein